MKMIRVLSATVLGATLCSLTSAQLNDDFDTDTSANYATTATGDAAVVFLFDYSTMGIPSAPNSTGGTTLGVRFEANLTAGASNAITLHTNQTFTGDHVVKFDTWVNANGPFPGGGGGPTEFITCGVGGDGATVNQGGSSGIGAWFAATGEGGSSRDYRGYKDSGEQFAASGQYAAGTTSAAQNNWDPLYAGFGSIDVGNLPVQGANVGGPTQQTGTSNVGSVGFAWHEVTIFVDADGGTGGATSVNWAIDGITVATLDAGIGSAFVSDGHVTIGYMDIFTSISDNPMLSFGLIDNLRVGNLAASKTYGSNPAHPTHGAATFSVVSDPVIGGTGSFDLSYASTTGEPGLLVAGLARTSIPFLDGTALVLPPLFPISFGTTPPATNFSFALPNDPALAGGQIYFQAAIADTAMATPNGLVFSNGLIWYVGS